MVLAPLKQPSGLNPSSPAQGQCYWKRGSDAKTSWKSEEAIRKGKVHLRAQQPWGRPAAQPFGEGQLHALPPKACMGEAPRASPPKPRHGETLITGQLHPRAHWLPPHLRGGRTVMASLSPPRGCPHPPTCRQCPHVSCGVPHNASFHTMRCLPEAIECNVSDSDMVHRAQSRARRAMAQHCQLTLATGSSPWGPPPSNSTQGVWRDPKQTKQSMTTPRNLWSRQHSVLSCGSAPEGRMLKPKNGREEARQGQER